MARPDGVVPEGGRARGAIEKLVPPGGTARAVLRVGRQVVHDGVLYGDRLRELWKVARGLTGAEPEYAAWLVERQPTVESLISQTELSASRRIGVRVEVVIRADRDGTGLDRTLDSLHGQTLRNWYATVVGRHASGDKVTSVLDRAWSDVLADVATGGDAHDLVVVLEAGDRLEPDFVFRVAARAWDNPFLQVIHWDDDVIDAAGQLTDPRFRPEWSPETLLSANYVGRSFAVRRGRLAAVGGPDASLGDATWWELLFRLDLDQTTVGRVPQVVSHLVRRPHVSASEGAAVVQAHLNRSGRAGTASPAGAGVRVEWELAEAPHVTIIIPTRHNRTMLSTCLPSLAKTDYPSFDVVIVDNGGRSRDNEDWYTSAGAGLDLQVQWWEVPFNYSAVNNAAASGARGEVLVFLNDDTELLDPGWLRELVSWTRQPGIGLVGVQLTGPDGEIQHAGVVLGMNGFADHLFAGNRPGDDTLIGSTAWYRDSLSVTAACVAVTKERYAEVGGFDERFLLCGSDVVLGFDMRFLGLRNVVTPYAKVRHLESATRGATVVPEDYPTSYWRNQKWLRGGDPYFSPNLSLQNTVPALRPKDEPGPMVAVGGLLQRDFRVFRQQADEAEALYLASSFRADASLKGRVVAAHEAASGPRPVRTLNWFVPEVDSPFYGGINTAFRIADHLAAEHGVANRWVVMGNANEPFLRSALAAAFLRLADCEIEYFTGNSPAQLGAISPADASIATQWPTAYSVAHFPHTTRRFYLIQDFEPMFYPAGTNYALAEETYNFGLYGLCNTERLLDIYRRDYGGQGMAFMPAVDQSVFHARGRSPLDHDGPATVFLYARPGHWRNCWELASLALDQVKQQLGDRVRIVTAGSWARPDDLGRGIEHLGLLDYRDTGALYRSCDAGIALTLSAHPSYLPLELMACGVPVVAFDNPAGNWVLHHERNSLRCPRTVDGLADAVTRIASDGALRAHLGEEALATIATGHSDWAKALGGIHAYLSDPAGQGA